MTMPLMPNGEVDPAALNTKMRERWAIMCDLWDANKRGGSAHSLTQRMNWTNALSLQLEWANNPKGRPVRLAYTTNGRPSAAVIHDREAVLDTTLYQVTCRDEDEACYLMAVINSDALADAARPFCAPNWAHKIRHLHKHLWKLDIPEFDRAVDAHLHIADLGRKAVRQAEEVIGALPEPTPRAADDAMRNDWQVGNPTAIAIEEAVGQLIGGAA